MKCERLRPITVRPNRRSSFLTVILICPQREACTGAASALPPLKPRRHALTYAGNICFSFSNCVDVFLSFQHCHSHCRSSWAFPRLKGGSGEGRAAKARSIKFEIDVKTAQSWQRAFTSFTQGEERREWLDLLKRDSLKTQRRLHGGNGVQIELGTTDLTRHWKLLQRLTFYLSS